MNTSLENIIILDIIKERGSPQDVSQACSNLSNTYYTQNAQADTAYAFYWGSTGNEEAPVKLEVGAVAFLLEYRASSQEVNLFGVCGSADYGDFAVVSGQTLEYNDGSLAFSVGFQLIDNTSIAITVETASSTTLNAKD